MIPVGLAKGGTVLVTHAGQGQGYVVGASPELPAGPTGPGADGVGIGEDGCGEGDRLGCNPSGIEEVDSGVAVQLPLDLLVPLS